eukprot:757771-Hanusia_phi.AAC.1
MVSIMLEHPGSLPSIAELQIKLDQSSQNPSSCSSTSTEQDSPARSYTLRGKGCLIASSSALPHPLSAAASSSSLLLFHPWPPMQHSHSVGKPLFSLTVIQ